MSNDSGTQISKSVLSPHVAEFIPSSFTKKLNQDSKHPTNSIPGQTSNTPLSVKDSQKQEFLHPKSFEKPRKQFTQNHEFEKRPISSSWRAPDSAESNKSTNSSRTKYGFVTYDKSNWRYRENEQRDDSQKISSSQSKNIVSQNDSARQDDVSSPRKPISFQTSLRSNTSQTQEQSRTFHRGFGRGRGKPRNAWTDDLVKTENNVRALRSNDSVSSSTPVPGQPVSYSDKLKGIDPKPVIDSLERHKTQNRENKNRIFQHLVNKKDLHRTPTTVECQDLAHRPYNDGKRDDGNEWTKVTKTKNEQRNACKEYARYSQQNSGTEALKASLSVDAIDETDEGREKRRARKCKNAQKSKDCEDITKTIDRKWASSNKDGCTSNDVKKESPQTHKTRWKGKPNDLSNTVQQHHSSPALSSPMTDKPLEKYPASTTDSNDILSKKPEKDFTMIKTAASNNKSKKIKLLKKNEEMPSENHDAFELVQDDSEFPDLGAAGVKSSESSSLASDWLSGGSRMPIISYSAALKTIPKPVQPRQPNRPHSKDDNSGKGLEVGDGESPAKKKKKKKKKKSKDKSKDPSKPEQSTPQQSSKKTKQPMQLDLGDWLSALEKPTNKVKTDKSSSKKITIATGVLQINRQNATDIKTPTSHQPSGSKPTQKAKGLHNILDSTAPVVKRGKEREVPKKKKPSALKKIILKEREEKKKALEGESQDTDHNTEDKDSEGEETQSEQPQEDEAEDDNCTSCDPKDETSSGVPSENDIRAQIHSRRFREYCDNVMDKELNNTTTELLQKLVIFQDRQYHKDPIKSKAKRRFVVGLREVTKHLKLKKIKLVIISPNVERIKSAGGLDDTLHNIITIAHQNEVPVVFALRRQILGRILHKKVPVSAIGIFNYDGAQDHFKELMELTEKARAVYAERWKKAYDELMERIKKETEELDNEQLQQEEIANNDNQESSSSDESDDNNDIEDVEITGQEKDPTLVPDKTSDEEDIEGKSSTIDMDINIEDL